MQKLIRLYLIADGIEIFSGHAIKIKQKTIIKIIRDAISKNQGDLILKGNFGCECETKKLVEKIRNEMPVDYVNQKGRFIDVHYSLAYQRQLKKRAKRAA